MTAHLEQRLLVALQRGLPISRTPLEDIATACGCDVKTVLEFVERLRKEGKVRRFGGVFDVRRLGYKSALCAQHVKETDIERIAQTLTPYIGVTHCYERVCAGHDAFPNLWFTLSEKADRFDARANEIRAQIGDFHILPALTRFKVDVVFGGATRAREESVMPGTPLTEQDTQIIRSLQGDTQLRNDYFTRLAKEAGMTEWDFLSTLEMWQRAGRLKRIALLLAHRAAGWKANGMCCWQVTQEELLDKGRALAAQDSVTHCYQRARTETFPYDLYAMIHAHELSEAQAAFANLEKQCGLAHGVMLISVREFKKTSMTFYTN